MLQAKTHLTSFLLLCFFSVFWLFPAIWNGFPIVYSDSGTYIESGFENKLPFDRPLTYGWLIYNLSQINGIWLVILFQSTTSALILFRLNHILAPQNYNYTFLISSLGLALFSSLPWFTSMLMADPYTALSILLLFIIWHDLTKGNYLWLMISIPIYWIISSTHLSNANTHLFIGCGLLLVQIFKREELNTIKLIQILILNLLIGINYLFIPAFHYYKTNKFQYPEKTSYFLAARFIETGSFRETLIQNCKIKNWELCYYKDSLPEYGSDFLWSSQSPLNKLNGWQRNLEEIKEINQLILFNPDLFVQNSSFWIKKTFEQLFSLRMGEEYLSFDTLSSPGYQISYRFRPNLPSYLSAKQQQNELLKLKSSLSFWIPFWLIPSLLIIVYLSIKFKINKDHQVLMKFIILGYLGNAITVSMVTQGSRYSARIEWTIVFASIMMLMYYLESNPKRLRK